MSDLVAIFFVGFTRIGGRRSDGVAVNHFLAGVTFQWGHGIDDEEEEEERCPGERSHLVLESNGRGFEM